MKITAILSILLVFMSFNVSAQKKILILGDSLTEGYGVDEDYSFPAILEKKLQKEKLPYKIINGGVSGSTTASGKSRLKWFLKANPSILILALGANDGLRGLKLEQSKNNLEEIIKMAKAKNMKIVIAGMMVPPNYGKEYTTKFKAMFIDLAKKYNATLIPFLLEGVAGVKELNIEDGIHPNSKGYVIVADTVYKYIKDLL